MNFEYLGHFANQTFFKDDLSPIKISDCHSFDEDSCMEYVFYSNQIESEGPKTLEETKISKEITVTQHYLALQQAYHDFLDKKVLGEELIKSWHQILMKDLDPNAGNYANHDRCIPSGPVFLHPDEIPGAMQELIERFDGTLEGITHFHYEFLRIHPFNDGNGRLSRIVLNYTIWQNFNVVIPIPIIQKKIYLAAIRYADIDFEERRLGPLYYLIVKSIHKKIDF